MEKKTKSPVDGAKTNPLLLRCNRLQKTWELYYFPAISSLRALLMKAVTPVFTDIMAGKPNESEPLMNYYRALGEDVKRQKERIGGNWAIATVLHSQKCRDLMK